ncbi:hypothetical protein DFR50_109147 [Roseiarcus fermentans]|uniref:Uncharacterized protein n=1 Tax=Roseiarcus fermentans TaxID=1473586 RepID=A0A366FI84_9HYPH|nr:hypothetical protein [Roseiarcus fermentans]RBP14393.1 hypothetical protein DFR50_109147 [Roseiarcus fermentans]
MSETEETAAPFFFAAEQPTASAIDDDIYLTVPAALPDFPGRIEAVDIVLTVEYARAVIDQLSTAVAAAARRREAG